MHSTDQPDRRRSERVELQADCRVLDPRTGRFVPGRSRDHSAGGARLMVRHGRRFEPGQRIALLMPMGEPGRVIGAARALSGVVLRVSAIGGDEQEIALQYENAASIAA